MNWDIISEQDLLNLLILITSTARSNLNILVTDTVSKGIHFTNGLNLKQTLIK
jgi:hypothetical protein